MVHASHREPAWLQSGAFCAGFQKSAASRKKSSEGHPMATPVIAQKSPFSADVEAGKSYWWCACGQSKNQPFCDGSHKGSAFTPLKYTTEKAGDYWLCACKHSGKKPLCDGTHKTLA